MPGKLNRRLSPTDAAFLYFERPNTPLHIGSLALYEGQVPYERFVAHLKARMPLIPRYRQRIASVPLNLAHPTWEDDPNFDIRRHIHSVELPRPGTEEQLRELTTRLFAGPLDREKPLWEMYIVNGVEGDRTGIVSKVHHCMVDGVSGIELLIATLDLAPEPAPPPPDDGWSPQPLPRPGVALADAFWDNVRQQFDFAHDVQRTLANPRPRLEQWFEAARAITAASWLTQPAPRTPFSTALSSERKAAFSEVSFIEIRQIRTSLGGTVNDVVLAILAGALRKYFQHKGLPVDGQAPRVAIPVNVRMEDEKGALGNRISAMVTALPIGEADPAERLRLICGQVNDLKKKNQAGALELLLRAVSMSPVPLQALAGRTSVNMLINLICTNVPGPMIPLYCVGHLMLAHYPLVPLSLDMGLGVGVTSYNQRLYFGVMVDPNAVPDVDLLRDCVDESFLELRDAAGVDVADVPPLASPGTNGGSKETRPAMSEQAR